MNRTSRRAVLAAGTVALAGCLTGESGTVYDGSDGIPDAEIDAMTASPDPDAVDETALPIADEQLPVQYDLETLRDNVVDGGVPQDGIPSIDEPDFESADEAGDRLDPNEPVFGVARDGETKAYPQSVLVHHEIVNDEVGGDSIAVTYCPLTGTAMGFERNGVEFGVSGRLLNSNLVMYDREGESWWPQMLATAIDGPLTAASLEEVPVAWATWEDWREHHPDTRVLTEDTGYARDYASDPYGSYDPPVGYYDPVSDPMFGPLTEDQRHPPKRMFLGARPPEGPLAIDREFLLEERLVPIEAGDAGFLAVSVPDLRTGALYHADDPGAWDREDDAVVDPDGERHDPTDLPIERVYAYDAMWFAWAGFYPTTPAYD